MNAVIKQQEQLHGEYSLTNLEYHSLQGISSSTLKYLEESVIHFENLGLFRFDSTTFNFGSCVHKLILEPEDFDKEFVVMPSFDGRTKKGKANKEAFFSENTDKTIIQSEDYEAAVKMAKNVQAIAGGLLQNGIVESSYFVDDDGLLIKCRPDYYIQRLGLVVDFKTTADISEFGIKKSIANYRYDWSAVFYMKVLRLLNLSAERFLFVFVEKTAPHMVKIREIDNESLIKAELEVNEMLDKYRKYKISGNASSIFKTIKLFGAN